MKRIALALLVLLMVSGCSTAKPKEESDAKVEVTWDATPAEGMVVGDYYKEEERFRQGHLGILEVVVKDDKLEYIHYNEYTRPNYYNRYFQNVSKRMSEYNLSMKEGKGAAWIEGVLSAEASMIKKQSLVDGVDTVAGASNSIEQAMVPMAEKINARLTSSADFTGPKFYQLTKLFDDGLVGVLKVVVQDKKIIDLSYDEIFPTDATLIKNEDLKKYAGLSKYDSVEYDEPSRIGFNIQMDELHAKVIADQDMFDLTGLPAIESTGDYKSAGYTERNSAWDNYLALAKEVHAQMVTDNVID
ncbi:FMN-binding protein [Erysipelothrix sp. HDW6C]|uniref:FMN-binding protein n=1 Tax=Erysipelothrix sp. HDW6C TaxID=2714930 RepID=UPI00140AD140|nr:FMN-binding protein [Erysipelothrix sp. HDW6C]QIK68803.1 FMN-binding protein [Erysipelothrix sp. HDW6C]